MPELAPVMRTWAGSLIGMIPPRMGATLPEPAACRKMRPGQQSQGNSVTIASMTGFARRQGSTDDCLWAWELKCVNGRNLDVRCRVPPGLDALDGFVRAACAERLKRGNLSVTLTV